MDFHVWSFVRSAFNRSCFSVLQTTFAFSGTQHFPGRKFFFPFWCNFTEAKINFTAENACLFLQLKVKIIEYKTFVPNYLQKMQQTFKEIAKATRQLTSAHLIKFSAISVNSLDLDSSFSE